MAAHNSCHACGQASTTDAALANSSAVRGALPPPLDARIPSAFQNIARHSSLTFTKSKSWERRLQKKARRQQVVSAYRTTQWKFEADRASRKVTSQHTLLQVRRCSASISSRIILSRKKYSKHKNMISLLCIIEKYYL